MTVQSTDRKAGPFFSGTVLPFSFKVFSKEDIQVIWTSAAGVESTLVLDSEYSVALNPDQDNTPGGSVTLNTAISGGANTVIIGDLEYNQGTDIRNQSGFEPEIVEDALDRVTILVQQLLEMAKRTLRIPASSSSTISTQLPQPTASNVLGWNGEANQLINLTPQDIATTVAFGTAFVDQFEGNGVQTEFSLSANPALLANMDVQVGGVSLRNGIDFVLLAGAVIKFTIAPATPGVPGSPNIQIRGTVAVPQGFDTADVVVTQLPASGLWTTVQGFINRIVSEIGASIVGYTPAGTGAVATTVSDILDAQLMVDYAALRAYTGLSKTVRITGLLTTAQPQGIAGFFQFDSTDTTSADNGGTIIVGGDGRRWKRVFDLEVYIDWFEPDPVNAAPQIQSAFNVASNPSGCKRVIAGARNYNIGSTIYCNPNTLNGDVPELRGQGTQATRFTILPSLGATFLFFHQGASPSLFSKWGGFEILGTGAASNQIGVQHANTCFLNYDQIVFSNLGEGVRFENTGGGFTEQNVFSNCWWPFTKYACTFVRNATSTESSFRGTGFNGNCHHDLTQAAGAQLFRLYLNAGLAPNVYDMPMNVTVWSNANNIIGFNEGTTPIRMAGTIQYESNGSPWFLTAGNSSDTFRGTINGIAFNIDPGNCKLLPPYPNEIVPIVRARNNVNQGIASSTPTKIILNLQNFSTLGGYDNSLSRFTPTQPGYYKVESSIRVHGTSITSATIFLYQNGIVYSRLNELNHSVGSDEVLNGSDIIYCNGTTDYLELWGQITAGGTERFDFANATAASRWSVNLIRRDPA